VAAAIATHRVAGDNGAEGHGAPPATGLTESAIPQLADRGQSAVQGGAGVGFPPVMTTTSGAPRAELDLQRHTGLTIVEGDITVVDVEDG
jgi:hypothetical protein